MAGLEIKLSDEISDSPSDTVQDQNKTKQIISICSAILHPFKDYVTLK